MSVFRTARLAVLAFATFSLASCGVPEAGPVPESGPQDVGTTDQKLTLVSCLVGSNVVTYTPPLKNTPQDTLVTTRSIVTNCVSLGGGVTSATGSSSTFAPQNSCLDLAFIIPTQSMVTWNTGETSQFLHTNVNTRVEGLAVILVQQGTVTAGKFMGASVTRTFELLNTDLAACSSPGGLATISGLASLTLLGP